MKSSKGRHAVSFGAKGKASRRAGGGGAPQGFPFWYGGASFSNGVDSEEDEEEEHAERNARRVPLAPPVPPGDEIPEAPPMEVVGQEDVKQLRVVAAAANNEQKTQETPDETKVAEQEFTLNTSNTRVAYEEALKMAEEAVKIGEDIFRDRLAIGNAVTDSKNQERAKAADIAAESNFDYQQVYKLRSKLKYELTDPKEAFQIRDQIEFHLNELQEFDKKRWQPFKQKIGFPQTTV